MNSSNAAILRRFPFMRPALAALLLSLCTALSPHAFAQQRLLSIVADDHQQPASASSSTDLVTMTPELTADILAARQHYQEAISAYKKLPQTPEILNKIGIACQHLQSYADARFYFSRAIHQDRKYAPAYNNLGTLEYHDKNLRRAERLYRRAIKLSPQTPQFWSNLGAADLAAKKYRDGAEAYQRAFVLDPEIFEEIALNGLHEFTSTEDVARMYLCFAGIFAQAGQKAQALEYIRKALLEGFRDRNAIQQDQQFATLRGDPAFDKLFPDQHKK